MGGRACRWCPAAGGRSSAPGGVVCEVGADGQAVVVGSGVAHVVFLRGTQRQGVWAGGACRSVGVAQMEQRGADDQRQERVATEDRGVLWQGQGHGEGIGVVDHDLQQAVAGHEGQEA